MSTEFEVFLIRTLRVLGDFSGEEVSISVGINALS
jgi:hypothetical protein